ncbi:TetR family transcriptional regulator [Rhizobium sp. ERR 922]|uniref:TetR/AcrR family transcriptional regulator n=1 Tax=unclassified Rhizobium TaxID=2613769 RepID=UPI00119D6EBF|nr:MULTISPECIES: TetR/AcrR family transcriptional regulator [unclassified Rhizobium]TWB46423.1 TetR family transcriptional regulator [Rhizobium sp. ERR 922]TWB88790.1 TetR family transcriptional regulator [Rhizobium sp. ERR 942]
MVFEKERQVRQSSKRGRPGGRSAQVVAAVHAATRALLDEKKYEQLEIPDIAERAGVNKTTIYRRWPTKAELVLDVAVTQMRASVPLPDTGELTRDLTMLLKSIATALATPFSQGLLRAMISLPPREAALVQPERFWVQRFVDNAAVVERAIERGEISPDTDARQLLEMAVAPLFFQSLIMARPIAESDIDVIARRVVAAFRT